MSATEYLGDSVYANYDGYSIRLYTSNGLMEYSEIYLEPEVADALVRFWKKWKGEKETDK